jgi:5'(3')-deoxyribonucleotidase
VVAVTAPLAESDFWTFERARWLGRRGFRKEDIVFASDKSLVTGDVLIDDGQHNIDSFRGPGVLIARPWNRGTLTLDKTVEALGG